MTLENVTLPPHDYKTERAILSCFLSENDLIGTTVLEPKHFFDSTNRNIFIASLELYKSGMAVDVISLNSKGYEEDHLFELSTELLSISGFHTYEQLLEEKYIYRKTIEDCNRLAALCHDDPGVDKVQSRIAKMTSIGIEKDNDGQSLDEVVSTYLDEEEVVAKELAWYKYDALDKITNGLRQGQLVVLGAGPGMGKSLFAMNILHKVMKQGVKCAIFSFEMTKNEIAERFFAMWSGVNIQKLDTKKAMQKMPRYMSERSLFVYDNTFALGRVLASIRKLHIQEQVKVVVIDYLQLIKVPGNKMNKNDMIGLVTRELKILAMELGINIILLSQLNRSGQKDEPTMSNLRDSGNIEQDANVILLMYGDKEDNDIYLSVAKNRNGQTGRLTLDIDYPTMRVKSANYLDY